MDNSCRCKECISACEYKPGWFLPGEAEKVAEHLNITLEELFKSKLGVDWWEAGDDFEEDVFVLSPGVCDGNPGAEFDGDPTGKCVFLDEMNMCQIYPVRPHECREMIHTENDDTIH